MSSEGTPARARAALRKASVQAYDALKAAGLSSGMVAAATGLSSSTVRKLGADGDQGGWTLPSRPTCQKVDDYCLTRLGRTWDLVRLRKELEDVDGVGRPKPLDLAAEALGDYLVALRRALLVAPTWTPYADLGDGYQERSVSAGHLSPRRTQEAELDSIRVRRGDVPWASALEATRVVAVIGDAGYGKSWQGRKYADLLAGDALSDEDSGQSAVPLWAHAADLARAWPGRAPTEAVADAATEALRLLGTAEPRMQDALAMTMADPDRPCVVVVDAYDEVIGQPSRRNARAALGWLVDWTAAGAGRRLVVTSRAAGWDDPLRGRDPETVYLQLGGLEERQVRRLWALWFQRRGVEVPKGRLDAVLAPGSTLRQFARIPLIAAFCAWVAETDDVARSRSELFGQVVERFLARVWKDGEPVGSDVGGDPGDGARRAAMRAALEDLAWEMSQPGRWASSVGVGECEDVLRRRGPATGHTTLTFEATRGIGILTQPAAERGAGLGDAPVSWVHRTVQEFMAARRLVSLGETDVDATVWAAWEHAPLSGVLDYALGLEAPASSAGAGPVRSSVARLAAEGRDPLGYYSALLAGSGRCDRVDVERVLALCETGILSPVLAARAVAPSGNGRDLARVCGLLLADPDRAEGETFEALAWCGSPGRTALAELAATDGRARGAAAALLRVDPEAAVTATEARVAAGLAVASADAACLREVGAPTLDMLLARVRDRPGSVPDTRAAGYTRHPLALELLRAVLRSGDAAARHAAAAGVAAWYGTALDPDGFALLAQVALHDTDPTVRLAVRGGLTAVALSVPWVSRAVDDLFEDLHRGPTDPPMTDVAAIVSRLWPVGPGTHLAVTMLAEEPRLVTEAARVPLGSLVGAALDGELDVVLAADVVRLMGPPFTGSALARLAETELGAGGAAGLATALALAVPADPGLRCARVDRDASPLAAARGLGRQLRPAAGRSGLGARARARRRGRTRHGRRAGVRGLHAQGARDGRR